MLCIKNMLCDLCQNSTVLIGGTFIFLLIVFNIDINIHVDINFDSLVEFICKVMNFTSILEIQYFWGKKVCRLLWLLMRVSIPFFLLDYAFAKNKNKNKNKINNNDFGSHYIILFPNLLMKTLKTYEF